MSLINKMLQDLDARGSQTGAAMQLNVKSVARSERRGGVPLVAGLAVAMVVLVAAGAFGWRYFKRPAPVAPVATMVLPAAKPVIAAAAAPAPAPHANVNVGRNSALPPRPSSAECTGNGPMDGECARRITASAAVRPSALQNQAPSPAIQKKPALAAPREDAPAPTGRQLTTQQRAENEYRRALASLQEGRVAEALGALEHSLQLDAHHDAARQTLVGLLIENKQQDEAIRQLQLGLTLDARQPSMAMLLARLQIERGASGVETLLRSLPYAAGNGDYHAFLGAALQREQRHREAAEQYQAALRGAPQNGVWLMGLGISLQAEQRNAEALDAFHKAKLSGSLSPELLAFVDRKLQQLSR
jgi:MSHA biogenesis protein MshN